MSDEMPKISPTAKFFKKELKLDSEKLTLEYMNQQNQKIESEQKINEIEKNIRKSEFPVLILGDNEKPGTPSTLLEDIQKSIAQLGFICALGTHIHKFNKGRFEAEVENEMFNEEKLPKLILMIDGKGFATIGESKVIRGREDLNNRTLYFFDHKQDYSYLVELAKNKQFPIEYKYPIPYHGKEELKGKSLFGVLHCFYRYWQYKRPLELKE